ncbi:lipoprotein signal peptidase [Ulvibacter litoralis]|uniref:Lipoprotein signal peptidase n=1 Tax=Ulvibacter litoralis TaxID=227084 RepID=A0A1G7D1Q2_9FLAO|nr:lipoprotein signal peptidase [Ulvibacter litoralis]GHC45399.1 lipoprotein signal peptidase [Ulvibacter litoralis]SDE44960.1 signal peptidase II [Ulvibacter litoralis]
MSLKKSILIIILVLLVDQISKVYIKTSFSLGDGVKVFDWFQILFVENEGMAWGAKIPGEYGKLFLTVFRLIAIVGIGYWLWDSVRKKASRVLVVAIALIFAGAFGNIIDSVFYGLLFNDSHHQVATFLPADGGYGTLLHGKVVDMLYFPLWKGYLPEWLPFWGGKFFTFFDPVFNIADMSISTGVGLLIAFNKRAFPKKEIEA